MRKKLQLNIITSFLLQIVTIASGFIIPKLILSTFGSEMNGLVSSINQFLNYVAIIEGGVNSVIMANLYKPLVNGDMKRVSSIIKTSDSFFKKITLVLILYTIILSTTYPLICKTSFSWPFVSALVVVLSIKLIEALSLC